MEGRNQNAYPSSPTKDPSQDWRALRRTLGARFDIIVKVEYPKPKRIVFLPNANLAQFWFSFVFENLHFFTLSTGDKLRTL